MVEHVSSETQDSSLYFISTQIQARHEDQEHKDNKLTSLQKFKNTIASPKGKAPKPAQTFKPKRKPSRKRTRQINSISAFVKETLGGKKSTDPQSILDSFLGDKKRLDDFLDEMEVVTATPHLLSKRTKGLSSELFTEPEWKAFSEKLRLKFPHLSKQSRKTLKVISKRLKDIKQMERDHFTSQDSNSVWSQASRQPSDDLSTEDLKWLYDLEDEQLQGDTSQYAEDPEGGSPVCLTLSQAVNDRSQRDGYDLHSLLEAEETKIWIDSNTESIIETMNEIPQQRHVVDEPLQSSLGELCDVIEDSEPEFESLPLDECDRILALEDSKNVFIDGPSAFGQKQPPRSSWNSETLSAPTSLVFASNTKKGYIRQTPDVSPIKVPMQPTDLGNMTIMSSPTPEKIKSKASFDTPSCLRVDSSPLTQQQRIDSSPFSSRNRPSSYKTCTQKSTGMDEQDLFLTANGSLPQGEHGSLLDQSDSESIQFSPLKWKQERVQSHHIEISGKIELDLSRSSKVQLTVLPPEQPSADMVIPDSEDEPDEISFVEITREGNWQDTRGNTSVLQVPSSPDIG